MIPLTSFMKDLSTTARVKLGLAMKGLITASVWDFSQTEAPRFRGRHSFARLLSHTRIRAPYPATGPGAVAARRT